MADRAFPARPASPSSPRRRRRCSSTAATRCRRAPRSSRASIEVSTLPRAAHRRVAGRAPVARADRRLRSAAAHHRRDRAPRSRAQAARHQAEPRRPQSRRPRVGARARPPAPKDPVALHPLKFAGRSAQDKIADIQKRLKADKQDAVVLTLERQRRLDVQHPRLRHPAHAGGARLRHRARKRQAGAVHRRRKARCRQCARISRRSPRSAEPDSARRTPEGAARGRQARASRSQHRRLLVCARARRRQGASRAGPIPRLR